MREGAGESERRDWGGVTGQWKFRLPSDATP